jgi:hypothetical protein
MLIGGDRVAKIVAIAAAKHLTPVSLEVRSISSFLFLPFHGEIKSPVHSSEVYHTFSSGKLALTLPHPNRKIPSYN